MKKIIVFSLMVFAIGGVMKAKEKTCFTKENFIQLRKIMIKNGTSEKMDGYKRINYKLQDYQLSYRKHSNMETIDVSGNGPFFWLIIDGDGLSHSSKSYRSKERELEIQSLIAHRRCELVKVLNAGK
ncbi:MAG: hypothetical protein HN576_14280 [Bacteriovoracaceae bacterium]|jgi:hypothetical protein|nr:hypothetical protein [Bacteriovoracaceae bacterium]